MATGRKIVEIIARVTVQEVAVAVATRAVLRVMAGEATGLPPLRKLNMLVVLHTVVLAMPVGCHLPLLGSAATALSRGTGMPEQQVPTPTGRLFMIATISIAVLTIIRSIELALMAQAISRIVKRPTFPLLHPLLPHSQSSPPL